MDEPITMTTLLLGAITALSGAVVFLFKQQISFHRSTIEHLKRCEDERQSLWRVIAGMKNKSVDEVKREAEQ